jgi:hypothetical protein
VDQFAEMLAQKLRQPLELKPDWFVNPLGGSLPGVRQWLELSMVVVPRWRACSLILMTMLSMWWWAEGIGHSKTCAWAPSESSVCTMDTAQVGWRNRSALVLFYLWNCYAFKRRWGVFDVKRCGFVILIEPGSAPC